MKNRIAVLLPLVALCAPTFAEQQKKMLVCHVDSEDGAVKLINVSKNSNHLGNPAHEFDGLTDYEPVPEGASGIGKKDSNGDGIADGCEPLEPYCPCWNVFEIGVIAANTNAYCPDSGEGVLLKLDAGDGDFAEVREFFDKTSQSLATECFLYLDKTVIASDLSSEEREACVGILVDACSELGDSP